MNQFNKFFKKLYSTPTMLWKGGAGIVFFCFALALFFVPTITIGLAPNSRYAFAGFGFNAPAARAPQAILLAVPPQPRSQLSNDVLLQILMETRDSAHIRAIRPEDMTDQHQLLSTMWFPASGNDRVRLDDDSQFWSFE